MTTPRYSIMSALLVVLPLLGGCLDPLTGRNVAVWAVPGDDPLLADSPPRPENPIYSATRGTLRLTAALNETVAFQVAVRTTAPPAGPFDVRLDHLRGPSDALVPGANIAVYRAHYTRVEDFGSWYPDHTGKSAVPTLFPDILVPWDAPKGGGPLRLTEARNEILWIDVRVPATVPPGSYTGSLELRPVGSATAVFRCQIELEVLPIGLPTQPTLPVIACVDPRDLLAVHLRWPRLDAEQTRIVPGLPSHLAAERLLRGTLELLQSHGTNPVLWASFPSYRPTGPRTVEVDWEAYDRLVTPWLDGTGFANRAPLRYWPIPASIDYPAATRNGGIDAPRYARLLAAYLRDCRNHFAERGWLERAFYRPMPPGDLTERRVERARIIGEILTQSEADLPLVMHLPAESLAGLGWLGAPPIRVPRVRTWAPPAGWFEPGSMREQRNLGRGTWFMPDRPPYSGSLAVEAPPGDARVLAWQAYRYDTETIWIENATHLEDPARIGQRAESWAGHGLVYPGQDFGLHDRPLPSMRLKRLRRGIQDHQLLHLLEENGKRLLAQSLSERVVRWAFTDACRQNLLVCADAGWPRAGEALHLARQLILDELASQFEPGDAARRRQIASVTRWSRLWNQADRIGLSVTGVRLAPTSTGQRAYVRATIRNETTRELQGRLWLPTPPPSWELVAGAAQSVAAGTLHRCQLAIDLSSLAWNPDGAYPFDLHFDAADGGVFSTIARLAVMACPRITKRLRIDGKLDDWPLAANNVASNFALCRGPTSAGEAAAQPPELPTQAFVARDDEYVYVAVRCTLRAGEPPTWRADNRIPVDGPIPWAQDVVEVLIDPRGTLVGSSGDLYCLQVKPSGLLVSRAGCLTDPPTGPVQPWRSDARVAVEVDREVWVVELAVPLRAFPPEGLQNPIWGFNITRLDARRGEYSSWSGARDTCYLPESLGNLFMLWP